MEKLPLYSRGTIVGELTLQQEGASTWFQADCRRVPPGICCAWVVGDQGDLRLGVLERQGDRAALRRKFSQRMTAPLGRFLRGEIRPAAGEAPAQDDWVPLQEGTLHSPLLREGVRGRSGVLRRTQRGRFELAIPYAPDAPFPFPEIFCFARSLRIRGNRYLVFSFDSTEQPQFP